MDIQENKRHALSIIFISCFVSLVFDKFPFWAQPGSKHFYSCVREVLLNPKICITCLRETLFSARVLYSTSKISALQTRKGRSWTGRRQFAHRQASIPSSCVTKAKFRVYDNFSFPCLLQQLLGILRNIRKQNQKMSNREVIYFPNCWWSSKDTAGNFQTVLIVYMYLSVTATQIAGLL